MMDFYWFISFATFTLIMSMNPSPNNLIILSTAANRNKLETAKQILAISLGSSLLLLLAILGLTALVATNSWGFLLAKYTGITYILYLAFELFFYKSELHYDEGSVKKYRSQELVWQQFASPKNWIMAFAIAAAFLPIGGNLVYYAFVSSILFALINLITTLVWAIFEVKFKKILSSPQRG